MTTEQELEKIYRKIDEVVPRLKTLRAILWLKEKEPNRLSTIYGDHGIEQIIDNCLKSLYDAQSERVPF